MGIMVEKSIVRKKLLQKLLSLTSEEIERRSTHVERNLSNLSLYKQAKGVMVYYPLRGEVDILGLVRKDLGRKRICFPVVDLERREIIPYAIDDVENDFKKGPYGILQPKVHESRRVDIADIDIVITPGLAFDRNKNRLGRGAGYYDRFLKTLSQHTAKIGIAFDLQVLPDLPAQELFDVKVDILVAESFVI